MERQRQATRPALWCAAFSTARAWRPAVVAHLAQTLGLACSHSPHRQRFLKLSSARSAGQVLSRLSASTLGFSVACVARAPHRSVQLQATLVSGASPPQCGQHGECQAAQWRACRAPVRNFSSGRAVASPARTVQGLTPCSSGAPTAGHQAPVWRYAVHFRQSGPGVLPLSPA